NQKFEGAILQNNGLLHNRYFPAVRGYSLPSGLAPRAAAYLPFKCGLACRLLSYHAAQRGFTQET
ncbi:MAG: hypothetical protein KJ899_03145, partial [Gammaproteobacteria bacterium]|nr:hypothetical protein [Gammaproteobacteria bacterium]